MAKGTKKKEKKKKKKGLLILVEIDIRDVMCDKLAFHVVINCFCDTKLK